MFLYFIGQSYRWAVRFSILTPPHHHNDRAIIIRFLYSTFLTDQSAVILLPMVNHQMSLYFTYFSRRLIPFEVLQIYARPPLDSVRHFLRWRPYRGTAIESQSSSSPPGPSKKMFFSHLFQRSTQPKLTQTLCPFSSASFQSILNSLLI